MTYNEVIAKRILDLCNARGIAINKLASMSGVNQSTVDNIVRGVSRNPRIMTLHKIAYGLNMTVSEFPDFKEMNEMTFEEDSAEDDE